jgi:heptosyltransferase-2
MLVVLPNWVGDLVLATPALRAIREKYDKAHISFLVKPHLADVLGGGDWMDEMLHWPAAKSRHERRQGFLGLAKELREQRFDWAVLLTNSFRSALLARLSGIRRRIGYDREGRGLLLTDKLLPEKTNGKFIPTPMTRYYNAVARYLGCRDCPRRLELFTQADDEAIAQKAITAAGVKDGQPIVVINPGAAFGKAKCWLPERFAEVADRLVRERSAAVFVACGPKELETARQVARHLRQPATILDNPVMRLGPLKALIRRAHLLITNDTGPRHFANAFGTPVVTVFGPTDPRWTETESESERSLMVKVHCGPCMKRECPLDHRCMTWVSSEMVAASAGELLDLGTLQFRHG